jgi:hypothetical protein
LLSGTCFLGQNGDCCWILGSDLATTGL